MISMREMINVPDWASDLAECLALAVVLVDETEMPRTTAFAHAELEEASSPRGDIIPEWWARSSRNGGRHQIGTVGKIIPEWWATSSGISNLFDGQVQAVEALESWLRRWLRPAALSVRGASVQHAASWLIWIKCPCKYNQRYGVIIRDLERRDQSLCYLPDREPATAQVWSMEVQRTGALSN
jgi:hypothetical protein